MPAIQAVSCLYGRRRNTQHIGVGGLLELRPLLSWGFDAIIATDLTQEAVGLQLGLPRMDGFARDVERLGQPGNRRLKPSVAFDADRTRTSAKRIAPKPIVPRAPVRWPFFRSRSE